MYNFKGAFTRKNISSSNHKTFLELMSFVSSFSKKKSSGLLNIYEW
jgi:hypothetical protein